MASLYSASASWVLPLPAVPFTCRRNGEKSSRRAQVDRPPDRRATRPAALPIIELGSGRRLSMLERKRVTLSNLSPGGAPSTGKVSRITCASLPLLPASMMWRGSMPAWLGLRTV